MADAVKSMRQSDLSYDHDADVLDISIGAPTPVLTHEEPHGLLLVKDSKTGDLVGATVLDCEEHFRRLDDLSSLHALPVPEEMVARLKERPSL